MHINLFLEEMHMVNNLSSFEYTFLIAWNQIKQVETIINYG